MPWLFSNVYIERKLLKEKIFSRILWVDREDVIMTTVNLNLDWFFKNKFDIIRTPANVGRN